MSDLLPSAAIVKAVRHVDFTALGKVSNSLSAALIHEIGRVVLVISEPLLVTSVADPGRGHVVIIDNTGSSKGCCRRSVREFDFEAGGHAVEGFTVDAEDFGGALAVVAGGFEDVEDVAALDLVQVGQP